MKGFIYLVLILALWVLVPASADEKINFNPTERFPIAASTCEECYYLHYEGSYSYDCYYYYCREEVYNKLYDKKTTSQTNLECDQCWYFTGDSYYTCVYYYCKNEILSALKDLYGLKKLESLDVLNTNSDNLPFYKSYLIKNNLDYSNDGDKIFTMVEKKRESMTYCDACYYYYTGDEYLECVYYYCKEEIIDGNKLFDGNAKPTSEPVELNACDDCYWYYYYGYTSTYYDCVYAYCKEEVLTLSEKNFKGKLSFVREMPEILYSNCELCDYYYTGDAWYDCIYYYCKDEILDTQQLIKSNGANIDKADLSRCTNYCYYNYYLGYYTYTEYSNCYYYYCRNEVASIYKELYTKNFIKTKKESELYSCSSCHYDYYEYAYHCYYCYKEAILDKTALFAEEPKDAKAGTCEYCYYDSYSYYECIYYYCKNEIMEKAKLVVTKNISKLVSIAPLQSSTCSECVYYYAYNNENYAYDCSYYNCRNEILNKNILFSGYSEEQKQDSCYECYNYDSTEYYNCIYWYCKDQILNKLESFFSIEKIEGSSCEGTCYMDWYFYGSDYFTCADSFCKNQRSENLITIPEFIQEKGGVQLDCNEACYYYTYTDDDYYECTFYYCKSFTIEKLSTSISSKKIETYTNCDTCYDNYFYGYYTYNEYNDCYYIWCKISDSNIIKTVKTESIKLSYCDDCWTYYYYGYLTFSEYNSCYNYYCKNDKDSVKILIKNIGQELDINSIQTSYCDDCWTYYYYEYLTYSEYYECAKFYCKENDVKNLDSKAQKIELIKSQNKKLDYCSDCADYLYSGYFTYSGYEDCAYRYCKNEILQIVSTNKKTSEIVAENGITFDYCYYCDYYSFGDYECYYTYCKSQVLDKIVTNAEKAIENNEEMTKCNNCYYLYYYGYYTYNDYTYCYYWYCKNEILSLVDLYKRNNSALDREKNEVKIFYSMKDNKGGYFYMSGFAVSAVVLGVVLYAGYSRRRQEILENEAPYKIIL
ncbi:hypothetical protein SteCoe_5060 [Stentor coeruleus]|uniref:Uncharacterized protein n=1 Tax=Stentor coeruleus TaxID=5963 RepID=A0A1R2CT81_9CILI|nr:hypothetical protein SteCoe_5060 [Stentor coeruleus]